MRVALVGNQVDTLVRFRGPLIKALIARDHRVSALVPGIDAAGGEAIRALGAEPVEIPMDRSGTHPVRESRCYLALRRTLRALRPDAVFCYFPKPIIYGMLAAASLGVRHRFCLIDGLGYGLTPNSVPSGWRDRALRSSLRRLFAVALHQADHIFTVNSDDTSFLVQDCGIAPERMTLLPGMGIDLGEFPTAPPMLAPVTFVFAGRLLRPKGVPYFVEAARLIRVHYPRTRFLVLGGLDNNPEALTGHDMQAWVNQGFVEWPGSVSDIQAWLAQASVFVLPSHYGEGRPRSIMEAMAVGRPVITTDWPGCREMVENGVSGFLVPVRDVEALAAAMQRFVDDPRLIPRMGAESRRIAEARYDVRKVNAVILHAMGL